MKNLASSDVTEETVVQTIIKAMSADLRPLLIAKQPKTYKDLTELVRSVQGVATTPEDEKVNALQQQVAMLTQVMQDGFAQLTRQGVAAASPTYSGQDSVSHQRSRVSDQRNRSPYRCGDSLDRERKQQKVTFANTDSQMPNGMKACRYCGECHNFKFKCPKFQNKKCYRCQQFGHIKSQCRNAFRQESRE